MASLAYLLRNLVSVCVVTHGRWHFDPWLPSNKSFRTPGWKSVFGSGFELLEIVNPKKRNLDAPTKFSKSIK